VGSSVIVVEHFLEQTFTLPRRLEGANVFKQLSMFLEQNDPLPKVVKIDFSKVTFIRPSNVVFLSNFSQWLHVNGCKVRYVGMNVARDSIKYLDDSLFFEQHLGKKLDSSSQCRKTTLPLQNVARVESHNWLESEFLPWVMNHSGLNKSSLAEVKTCLQELLNNISDHTDYDYGCLFSQWYPKEKQIIVSVADFGIGIPNTVRTIKPNLADCDAIELAAQYGFSAKSTPRNRGAGLDTLIANIVEDFDGKVMIRSNSGLVKFAKRGDSRYISKYDAVGWCIGTTIEMVIPTNQIPVVEEEESFEW